MTDRQKYDPSTPRSFCDKCHKLDFTRKRGARWLCAKCTKAVTDREKALAAAKAELEASRTPDPRGGPA